MNPGKGMAQASHASNAFVHHYHRFAQEFNARPVNTGEANRHIKGFNEWENSTSQGFGTVLTLEARGAEIWPTIDLLKALGYIAGVVHDPTYPLVDGEVVHHIPIDTCAYVFVPNKEEDQIAPILLKKFPLHR
jgi:hypothetical protein